MNIEVSSKRRPLYQTVHEQSHSIMESFFKDIQKGDLKKVKMRLQPGSGTYVDDGDGKSRKPLMYASAIGHIEIVKLLLEKGANVNTKDKDKAII